MIRKYWWTALVGAALVGCQGDEPNNSLPQNGKAPDKVNAGSAQTQPGGTAAGYGDGASKDSGKAAKAEAAEEKDKQEYKQGDDKNSAGAAEEKADEKAKGELDKPKGDADTKDEKAEDKKDGDKAAANVTLTPKQVAAINELPDAKDREAALAQKVCLISGKPLGGMGMPFKVTADGKTGFLCCDGCKEEFDKDPKAALAKAGK